MQGYGCHCRLRAWLIPSLAGAEEDPASCGDRYGSADQDSNRDVLEYEKSAGGGGGAFRQSESAEDHRGDYAEQKHENCDAGCQQESSKNSHSSVLSDQRSSRVTRIHSSIWSRYSASADRPLPVRRYSVRGTRPSKNFTHETYSASSSLRAWTLRFPSVVLRTRLRSLKLSESLVASALTMPSRIRS